MGSLILPEAEWRRREGLDCLVEVLGTARFVGGAVRDTLMGAPVADVDLATPLSPTRVIELLEEAAMRVVPTGLGHGTVTAILASGPVEITTLRRDVHTDGRHALVAFTDDWQEDAARRDFTINALYADPVNGTLFDYFGGLADLERRHVRFIGDPLQRIAEDHLRILRFFRFLARFGDVPDPAGLQACTSRARDLMALSRERIADEMLKLLVARNAVAVVRLMVEHGIFAPVIPEVDLHGVERLARLAAAEASAQVEPDCILRLAALLPRNAEMADNVGARLKLSNAQRKRLITATTEHPPMPPHALAYRLGVRSALDVLLLRSDAEAALAIKDWLAPRMPLSGGALVARGLTKGPVVARVLRQIEEHWIAEGFPDQARVEQIADSAVAQALRETRKA